MRICIMGKYPPIQGGVSMRTYWNAHRLAALGHEVHVVTNALEVGPPYRMHMRAEDWQRCDAVYGAGSVTTHWTDPIDDLQTYIPMAIPFISKLAALALRAHADHSFDVIYSHYMEPYGVAAHLAAQMVGVPHVTRMAGSDAGRLWSQPQFEMLYDQVLRSAQVLIAAGRVAERAVRRGVKAERIAVVRSFVVPEELFTPEGQVLNLSDLRAEVAKNPDMQGLLWGEFHGQLPYFGVYGKLGENKGSFVLLDALRQVVKNGGEVGLVVLAHGSEAVQSRFRERAQELGLVDRILQIPFLPHWRVPEFLRGCLAVCCLEQDFPIGTHSPIVPREVLLCGRCLVGATEVIRKLPTHERLPSGYACVAIDDVNDGHTLSKQLAAIVENPALTAMVGARGRVFAQELQQGAQSSEPLEHILAAAAQSALPSKVAWSRIGAGKDRFPFSQLAANEIEGGPPSEESTSVADLSSARNIRAELERRIACGMPTLYPLAVAVQTEVMIATVEDDVGPGTGEVDDPLFRLRLNQWAMEGVDLDLVPTCDPRLGLVEFSYDISSLLGAESRDELPGTLIDRPSYIVAFGPSSSGRRDPLLIDSGIAQILRLSDGTRTVGEIIDKMGDEQAAADTLSWIESMVVVGLLGLQTTRRSAARPVVERHQGPPLGHLTLDRYPAVVAAE